MMPAPRWLWSSAPNPQGEVDQIAYDSSGRQVARWTVSDGALTYIGRCDSMVVSRPDTQIEFDGLWALHATAAELGANIHHVRGGADITVRGKPYQPRVILSSEGFQGGGGYGFGMIWPISLVSMDHGARGMLGRAVDLWLLNHGEYVERDSGFLQFGRLIVPRASDMRSERIYS